MRRVVDAYADPNAHGAGKAGFTEGDASNPATRVPEQWLNDVQEEIALAAGEAHLGGAPGALARARARAIALASLRRGSVSLGVEAIFAGATVAAAANGPVVLLAEAAGGWLVRDLTDSSTVASSAGPLPAGPFYAYRSALVNRWFLFTATDIYIADADPPTTFASTFTHASTSYFAAFELGTVLARISGATVLLSADGAAWVSAGSLSPVSSLRHGASDGSAAAIVINGFGQTLLCSDNSGATWTVGAALPVDSKLVWAGTGFLAVDPAGFVLQSTDGGASWSSPVALPGGAGAVDWVVYDSRAGGALALVGGVPVLLSVGEAGAPVAAAAGPLPLGDAWTTAGFGRPAVSDYGIVIGRTDGADLIPY